MGTFLQDQNLCMLADQPLSASRFKQISRKGSSICSSISQLSEKAVLQYITFNPVWTSFHWEIKSILSVARNLIWGVISFEAERDSFAAVYLIDWCCSQVTDHNLTPSDIIWEKQSVHKRLLTLIPENMSENSDLERVNPGAQRRESGLSKHCFAL